MNATEPNPDYVIEIDDEMIQLTAEDFETPPQSRSASPCPEPVKQVRRDMEAYRRIQLEQAQHLHQVWLHQHPEAQASAEAEARERAVYMQNLVRDLLAED